MTYNVFGGTLSLNQSINQSSDVFSLDLTIANGGSTCLSVRPSIRHIRDPRLKDSTYRNTFAPHDRAMFLESWMLKSVWLYYY